MDRTRDGESLIVIDPYFDDSVLPLVAQKRPGVSVFVVKNKRRNLLHAVDVARFNAQYGNSLAVKESTRFHDRFLIIDRSTLIHVGASLNHLGKKCFAFASLASRTSPTSWRNSNPRRRNFGILCATGQFQKS